jgi:hypothetical protein
MSWIRKQHCIYRKNISSEVIPVHPSDEEQQERLLDIFTAVDLRGDGVGQLVIQLLNHNHNVFTLPRKACTGTSKLCGLLPGRFRVIIFEGITTPGNMTPDQIIFGGIIGSGLINGLNVNDYLVQQLLQIQATQKQFKSFSNPIPN